MSARIVLGNIVLAVYLWITFCAFMLTILRLPMYYPRDLVLYAYGMMAPYQAHESVHSEILAEGLREDGTWESIDLAPYYPVMPGERNVREYFAMFKERDEAAARYEAREAFADRLHLLESRRGRTYRAIRFIWLEWPPSPGSFRELKLPAFTTRLPLFEKQYE